LALGAGLLGFIACHDSTPPGGGEPDLSLVSLAYLCGTRFGVSNGNLTPVAVRFEVPATGEAGDLTLPARGSGGSASVTRLVTLTTGDVRLAYQGTRIADAANVGGACAPPTPTVPEPMASTGEWSAPFAWPVVAVHLHLLPDGRVLSWGRTGDPQIWDPATGGFTAAPTATDVFCAGHGFLPDGRLLVAGGHISDFHGLPDANLFDPSTGAWTSLAPMAHGRWYPTVTTLANGQAVAIAGQDQAAGGSWTPVATSLYGRRDYGSAVMYEPGKVLIVGGSDPPDGAPTATAETIDLGDGAPVWRSTASMAFPRRHLNLTLLPDGRAVATGGTSTAGFSDLAGAVHVSEVWNPATGTWTTWASNAVSRVYHSTTLLLPDGRLLHAGSGDGANLPRELTAELFTPPYLFLGPRPAIASAPASVTYGAGFQVGTPDAGAVTRVTLVRLPSVTHAFDQNQRLVPLAFSRSAGGLTVTAPASANLAPPGHYMLFLLDADGVPSVARIVRVG
jgi:galactose oxidase